VRPIIISLAFVLVAARAAAEDVPDAWLGHWRLNVSRSTYAAEPPYRRATYRIARTAGGFTVVYDMVHPRGGTTHLEWTGRMDGRDYRVQGVDEAMTYAYTPAGPGAADVVVKIDGRVAARSRISVSADGRTMTTRTTVTGAPIAVTTVYEKQPAP
jgi:hypothetical protein